MIEVLPPYSPQQLAEFATNISDQPPAGYPQLDERLFLKPYDIAMRLNGNTLRVPPGHDAHDSPNRQNVNAPIDPEILTGDAGTFTPHAPYLPNVIRDQHNRPVHPGFLQLLSLARMDGQPLGMPTGIGCFYYYGENAVADAAGVFRANAAGDLETVLIRRPGTPQSPRGGWATPGGYAEPVDQTAAETTAIACARRELREETGLETHGRGIIVARKMPISSVHTLNAWTKTTAVAFPHEDQAYLHDTQLQPNNDVLDAAWFPVHSILNGEVDMWSQDHVRYIQQAHAAHQQLAMPPA